MDSQAVGKVISSSHEVRERPARGLHTRLTVDPLTSMGLRFGPKSSGLECCAGLLELLETERYVVP